MKRDKFQKLIFIRKEIIIFFLLICVPFLGIGQLKLPEIIPPSPQSKAFQRYGEYPVNYNNGVPDISIPLYTIKSGKIEVPIVLRYYASGIKPYEPDMSNIGAGWTLDVGGMINRSVLGKADESYQKPYPMKTQAQINQENFDDIIYLDNLLKVSSGKDSRYDQFSYRMGDKHGSFAIEDDQNGNFQAFTYPFVPYKIQINTQNSIVSNHYKTITGIDVTDDHGFNYKFGYNNIEKANDGHEDNVTGWYLEKISEPFNANEVNFNYVAITPFLWGTYISSVDITSSDGRSGDNAVPYEGTCEDQSFGWPTSIGRQNFVGNTYSIRNINEITFRNGMVKFNLDASGRQISSIVIYKEDNTVLRKISFERDYFPGSTKHLRLKALKIESAEGLEESYSFSYDINHPVADNRCIVDQWGYCRGEGDYVFGPMARTVPAIYPITSTQSTPAVVNLSVGNTDLSPNDAYMKRYVLTKITYPTGGITEFDYEANEYFDIINRQGGGLRIKEIRSTGGNGPLINRKRYEYAPGFLEYPLSRLEFSSHCTFYSQLVCHGVNLFDEKYYIFRNLSFANGVNGELGPNPVYYKKVTEYFGDLNTNTGKTVYNYEYNNPNQSSVSNISGGIRGTYIPNYYMHTYRNWGNGLLKSKETYRNSGGNNYELLEETINNYEFLDIKTLQGLYVYLIATYGNAQGLIDNHYARLNYTSYGIDLNSLLQCASVNEQRIVTGVYHITSSLENKYSGNSVSSLLTSYEYGNANHYYPTKITRDLSDGRKSMVSMAYVDEFSSKSIYGGMKALNIIAPVIENKEYLIDGQNQHKLIRGTKTEFSLWNQGTQYLPRTDSVYRKEGYYEPYINYLSYSNTGNLQSVQKVNGPTTSYIWSYQNEYPVIKVENAKYEDIESVLGGSNLLKVFSGQNPDQQTIKAKVDQLKSSFPEAQVESYSYSPLVGMTSNTNMRGTIESYGYDGFQRLKHVQDHKGYVLRSYDYKYRDNSDPSAGTAYYNQAASKTFSKNNCGPESTGSSMNYVVPAGKHVSTISQAMADSLAQQDIRANGQNYANENGSCTVNYYENQYLSQTFARNNCGPGSTGSNVTYVVPAGTYNSTISQEAANSLAQQDIQANGQNYANANGTCTISYSTLTIFNNTNASASHIHMDLWNGASLVKSGNFSSAPGGNVAFTNIPPGSYKIVISVNGGGTYSFRIPFLGVTKTGNSTFDNVPFNANESVILICERVQ
ncbi:DUF5977 domain-containing protein [Sphingobacterium siyangense]|uniref:DUF5977 domain-containing protein n=1 Tax=Sphingobacterium siyangense TaxID=459529 RepID=UPI001962B7E3|nr:DUF5977 domain-containing protein [Sphingobacterium siyangense]QRY58005.1 hypothetical protein JVX97_00550 [Sphingobacterium siyangense]